MRLVLQTIYILNKEILQSLSLKSAVYNRKQFQIKNGLYWRVNGRRRKIPALTSVTECLNAREETKWSELLNNYWHKLNNILLSIQVPWSNAQGTGICTSWLRTSSNAN